MYHTYSGMGWCAACCNAVCQFTSFQQEQDFYKSIMKPYTSITPLIEKASSLNTFNLFSKSEDNCTCSSSVLLCPEHGILNR